MNSQQENHCTIEDLLDQARTLLANKDSEWDDTSRCSAIEANHLIAKAMKIHPELYSVWILRCQALSLLGDNKGALKAIEMAMRFSSRSAESHYWHSAILTDLNQLSEALKSIDRAMRYLNADESWLLEDIFCDKAMILDSLGRNQEAVETYEAGLQQCPRSSLLNSGLAPFKRAKPRQKVRKQKPSQA